MEEVAIGSKEQVVQMPISNTKKVGHDAVASYMSSANGSVRKLISTTHHNS